MTIYSGFSHWKWWFSIVMLVYQRVQQIIQGMDDHDLVYLNLGDTKTSETTIWTSMFAASIPFFLDWQPCSNSSSRLNHVKPIMGWRWNCHTLWQTNIAIENDHRNRGIFHWKWWFSIVMLVYRMVNVILVGWNINLFIKDIYFSVFFWLCKKLPMSDDSIWYIPINLLAKYDLVG